MNFNTPRGMSKRFRGVLGRQEDSLIFLTKVKSEVNCSGEWREEPDQYINASSNFFVRMEV